MSFGNYSFAGGHGIAHKMSLKCTKNLAKYIPDMRQGRQGPQPSKLGPRTTGEQAQKSYQTNSTLRNTTMVQI